MNNWLHIVQSTAFSPTCVLCHAATTLALDLCTDCQAELPRQQQTCRNCALTLPATSAITQCRDCLRKPRFDGAMAAFEYVAPVDWLITQLKFHNRLSHARLLGALLAERFTTAAMPRPDCIVPVPLHPRRYRERGYNQATLIARHAAGKLDMRVQPHLATRVRHTAPQLTLPADQRRRNMHNAFSAHPDCVGRHIAIVDDVVTTAHTAGALAATLKRRGAVSVQLWCVARA